MMPEEFSIARPVFDRKRRGGFTLSDIPKAAWIATALVVVVMSGLYSLSRPFDAKSRLDTLEQQAKIIKSAVRSDGDLMAFGVGSVCTGALDDAFKSRVSSALMNAGLKVDVLDVTPRGRTGEGHPLMAYGVSLKGTGSYEQAVGALEVLAHEKPKLFLDSLIMRNQTASVDLSVEGRLYCRWTKPD